MRYPVGVRRGCIKASNSNLYLLFSSATNGKKVLQMLLTNFILLLASPIA